MRHANTIPLCSLPSGYYRDPKVDRRGIMFSAFARGAALLTLLCLIVACRPSQISAQLTSEALRTSGKSVLVLSVRLISKTMSTSCDAVQLTRVGDGRKVDVMLASHLPSEPS